MAREQIGSIYVDAGKVMLADPCYALPDSGTERTDVAKDWMQFCQATQFPVSEPFSKGFGLVLSGLNDGRYPVFVEKNDAGRITSMTVEF